MKQLLALAAVMAVAATGAMAQAAGGQATDEAAIRQLASQYQSAWNSRNAQRAAAIFAEDARFVTTSGEVLQGRPAIEKNLSSDFQQMAPNSITVTTQNVRMIDPRTAVSTGTTRLENAPPGTTGEGHWMVLAKKVNGEWKVAEVLAAAVPSAMAEPSSQPTGTSGRSAAAAETELRDLESRWSNAMKTGDTASIARIYAPSYTLVGPDGKLMTGAEDLENMKSGNFKVESAEHSDVQPRVYGDTAVVTGMTTLKGTYNGEDISGRYRWTDTFVRQNGEWKAVSSQVTKVADMNMK